MGEETKLISSLSDIDVKSLSAEDYALLRDALIKINDSINNREKAESISEVNRRIERYNKLKEHADETYKDKYFVMVKGNLTAYRHYYDSKEEISSSAGEYNYNKEYICKRQSFTHSGLDFTSSTDTYVMARLSVYENMNYISASTCNDIEDLIGSGFKEITESAFNQGILDLIHKTYNA